MKYRTRVVTLSGLAALAAIGVFAAACDDAAVAPSPIVTDAPVTARAEGKPRALTIAELRQRNPLDWAADVHNALIDIAIDELKKPEVGVDDLCARVQARIGEVAADGRFAGRFDPGAIAALRQGLQAGAFCNEDQRRKVVPRRAHSKLASFSQSTVPSAQAEALYSAVADATESASGFGDLANQLGAISAEAQALGGIDAAYVEVGIAIAYGSADYWSGSGMWSMWDAVRAELDQCYTGSYEGMSYESEGTTYQCQGSEWRLASGRRLPPLRTHFQLASFSTAQGPCDPHWAPVAGWDVRGGQGALALFPVLKAYTIHAIVGAAAGGSAIRALYELYKYYTCWRER
jgi:hypothetical protein